MERSKNQFVWKESFPPVYGHTSISFLKHCPGFSRAKNGDMDAALAVVNACVKQDLIVELNKKYPNAILLPIVTKNRLPEALARVIGQKVHSSIYLSKTIDRKSLSAMERLLHSPKFSGSIMKGETYIIIDDIVTQGGTISALRKYIISRGGTVAAIIALACSIDSQTIAPSSQDVSNLMIKFNCDHLSNILRKYRIAEELGELTKSQVKYLLKFNGINKINSKLESASDVLYQKGYNVLIS